MWTGRTTGRVSVLDRLRGVRESFIGANGRGVCRNSPFGGGGGGPAHAPGTLQGMPSTPPPPIAPAPAAPTPPKPTHQKVIANIDPQVEAKVGRTIDKYRTSLSGRGRKLTAIWAIPQAATLVVAAVMGKFLAAASPALAVLSKAYIVSISSTAFTLLMGLGYFLGYGVLFGLGVTAGLLIARSRGLRSGKNGLRDLMNNPQERETLALRRRLTTTLDRGKINRALSPEQKAELDAVENTQLLVNVYNDLGPERAARDPRFDLQKLQDFIDHPGLAGTAAKTALEEVRHSLIVAADDASALSVMAEFTRDPEAFCGNPKNISDLNDLITALQGTPRERELARLRDNANIVSRALLILKTDYSAADTSTMQEALAFLQDKEGQVTSPALKTRIQSKSADLAAKIRHLAAGSPKPQSFPPSVPPGAGAAAASLPPQPPDFKGEHSTYRKIKQIGKGGFGEIWLVENAAGNKVALKILQLDKLIARLETDFAGKTPEVIARTRQYLLRFEQEYAVGIKGISDTLVRNLDTNIYDVFPALRADSSEKQDQRSARLEASFSTVQHLNAARSAQVFIVMEFVAKEDGSDEPAPRFSDVIRGMAMPSARVLTLFLPLLETLADMHRKGIYHRDLKPLNYLLAKNSRGEEFLKLIDLGICKDVTRDTDITSADQIPGSFEYLPPLVYFSRAKAAAQKLAEAKDANAVANAKRNIAGYNGLIDIYQMGINLYKVLTGSNPLSEIDKDAHKAYVTDPEKNNPFDVSKIPDESLRPVIQKMLSPVPEKNYLSMDEVISALSGNSETEMDSAVRPAQPKPAPAPAPAPGRKGPPPPPKRVAAAGPASAVDAMSEAEAGQYLESIFAGDVAIDKRRMIAEANAIATRHPNLASTVDDVIQFLSGM